MAKDDIEKEGFDYEKTFSPVAMIKSIMILLSNVTHMDYEICQMDVKTTFLNGSFDETFIWYSQKDSLQKARKIKCASCKSSFMDLSKHQDLGTS